MGVQGLALKMPLPSLTPVVPTEAPALTTPEESDDESIVVAESSETPEPWARTQTGSSDNSASTKNSEPRVGLQFAILKTPPPTSRPAKKPKDGKTSRQRSRSRSSSFTHSKSRQREEARTSIPRGVNVSDAPTLKRGRGKGRDKIGESANTPLVAPSYLSGITKPREGLKITISAEGSTKNGEVASTFPPAIQHLSNLGSIAIERWELSEATSVEPGFIVEVPQEAVQEDSDVDLRMGKVKDSDPWKEPLTFTYKGRSVLEDHQWFAAKVLRQESRIWDRLQVENNPSLFYQEYFLDQQKIADVRSKGQAKIQHFNVKVTRQEPNEDVGASSKANREKLEAKFKPALNSLYEAFEEAYQFEHPEFIAELRNHLVKTAVTQMTSLFASSRCRYCYRGRRMDAAWRWRRFEKLLPFLSQVPLESFRRVEDHRANVL